jgi:hypothetical protein
VLAKNEDSSHWYPCGDGKCGSNGDFTEINNKLSPVCFGKRTCWAWRHVDDGNSAKGTFTVTFHRRDLKCVRNCPAISAPAASLPVGAPVLATAPDPGRLLGLLVCSLHKISNLDNMRIFDGLQQLKRRFS